MNNTITDKSRIAFQAIQIIFWMLVMLAPKAGIGQGYIADAAGGDSTDVLSKAIHLKDSLLALRQLPTRYLGKVSSKADQLNSQLSKKTEKALRRLQRQEEKINSKLSKIDSVAAHNLFSHSIDSVSRLQDIVRGKVMAVRSRIPGGQYIPYLDTLKTSLAFLDKYSNQLSQAKAFQQKLQGSMNSVQQLEGRLQQVQDIQQYIRQRQQLLTQSLSRYGSLFTKYTGRIGKETYYYQAQIQNYKELWQHPDQVEQKAIALLNKTPVFTRFMEKHSILASLFRIPDNYGSPQALNGLQTRAQVEQLIQQRLQGAGASARQAISQQMQQAQQQLNELKDKFPGLNSTAQMPDFKPNDLKSKTLLQRITYGANIQFSKATGYFPTTSDIAVQAAYKFSKNGSAGIGSSFKLGWGSNIRKIRFTAQGLGLRSFLDYRLKGSFYVNGGFELNHLSTIPNIPALRDLNGWTRSALLGIERKYKISDKLSGNVILLYDFLHNRHIPATSPVLFRMGYEF